MPARSASRWSRNLVDGEDIVVVRPGHLPLACNLRPVLARGGHTSEEVAWTQLAYSWALGSRFVLIGADYGGPSTWGNELSTSRVDAVLAWARAEGIASDDPPVTVGVSMGNLVMLNWVRTQSPGSVAGHISVAGAYNLTGLHDGLFTDPINTAYGGYDPAVDGPTRDPLQYASELSWLPVRTFYSPSDAVVDPDDEQAFAAAHGNTQRTDIGDLSHDAAIGLAPSDGLLAAAVELVDLSVEA